MSILEQMKMKNEEEQEKPMENCVICEKPIFRSGSASAIKLRRTDKAITCSPHCSKIYTRASVRIRQMERNKKRRLEKNE